MARVSCNQKGAALPIVLILIAGMSLIMAAAYQTVTTSMSLARELQNNAGSTQAMFSAEEQSIFSLLIAQATPRGLYFGEPINVDQTLFEDVDYDALGAADLWAASGVIRKSSYAETPVLVHYRDGGAFFSLARISSDAAEVFFNAIGISSDVSEEMAARLSDYQDMDIVRRYRGAERSDYRLKRMPPPTNAPLRTHEELSLVLGFEEQLTDEQWLAVEQFLTFSPEYIEPKRAFMIDGFEAMFEVDRQGELSNAARDADETPSARARFTITAHQAGSAYERVVEIHRAANGAGQPFKRYLVSEGKSTSATPPSAEEWNGYQEIFQPAPADTNG